IPFFAPLLACQRVRLIYRKYSRKFGVPGLVAALVKSQLSILQRISIEWAGKTMILTTEGTERTQRKDIKIFVLPAHSIEILCNINYCGENSPSSMLFDHRE